MKNIYLVFSLALLLILYFYLSKKAKSNDLEEIEEIENIIENYIVVDDDLKMKGISATAKVREELKKEAEDKLETVFNNLSVRYWGIEYNSKISIDRKYKVALGRFHLYEFENGERIPWKISLSKWWMRPGKGKEVVGTIKHELCHWAMFTLGKDYDDGEADFENDLLRIGAPSSPIVIS